MSDIRLPCPFCGHAEPTIRCDDLGWGKFKTRILSWWIECQGAHCYAKQQGSTEEKVTARWNKRKDGQS